MNSLENEKTSIIGTDYRDVATMQGHFTPNRALLEINRSAGDEERVASYGIESG